MFTYIMIPPIKSIFKNSQNSTEDDLILQIINPINPQDTKVTNNKPY
jgi:hypothetical protein